MLSVVVDEGAAIGAELKGVGALVLDVVATGGFDASSGSSDVGK